MSRVKNRLIRPDVLRKRRRQWLLSFGWLLSLLILCPATLSAQFEAAPSESDLAPSPAETTNPADLPGWQIRGVDAFPPTGQSPAYLFPQAGRFRVWGWLDAGYMGNTSSPSSRFNGPYNAVDRNEPMFNQGYLVTELERDGDEFGIGARADLLYGNDFLLAQSVGLEVSQDGSSGWNGQYYGLAIPQAYVDLGNDTLSVQVGHFYTVVGFEGVPAINNFFYTHAYSYQFAGPFTEWGALATWNASPDWQFQAGPVNRWNTLVADSNNVEFLGRAKYTSPSQAWWSSFAIITGNEPNNVAGLPDIVPRSANRTRYSFLFDQKFGGFEYVFHQWLGSQQSGTSDGSTAWWYGIDQYLFYRLSERWKLGGRFEWFRDEAGTRVGLNRPSNPNKAPLPGNFFSFTVGPNYSPHPNLVVRPEIRWDFYDGNSHPFNDGQSKNQVLLGLDAILRF